MPSRARLPDNWYRSDMLPTLASRVSPRWLAPLGLATLGTLVLVAATTPEPRSGRKPGRQMRVGRCGQHATQATIERRLVEHAIEARSGQLEACVGGKRFDLVVTQQIQRGGHVLGMIVEGTASTASSRCFQDVLAQISYPPITRPVTVTTRLRLERGELVVDATARR